MRFDAAFYRGFHDELGKEAWIPQAIALGARVLPAALRAGKAVTTAARAAKPVANVARKTGGGIWSKAKNFAGNVAGYAPLPGGGGPERKHNTYV